MTGIVKNIISTDGAYIGEVLTKDNLVKLEKLGFVPSEYISFIKEANGVKYNGASIYGVRTKKLDSFDDVVFNNLECNDDLDKLLLLGDNEYDYLFYNKEIKEYQIVDKMDMEMLESYSELDDAIARILSIEW